MGRAGVLGGRAVGVLCGGGGVLGGVGGVLVLGVGGFL